MRRHASLLALLSVVPALLAGCAGRQCCPESEGGLFGSQAMTLSGAAVPKADARGKIAVDARAVPSPEEVETLLAPAPGPASYYVLSARQCQCLAVANAAVADAVDEESQLSAAVSGRGRSAKARSAALQSGLLGYEAAAQRNQAAAEALEWFYRLAEAEATCDLLDESLGEIGRAIEDFDRVEAQGIETKADGAALRRQRTALLDKKSQALLAVEQINGRLRSMLGDSADDQTRIWPRADLSVEVAKVDVEHAVRQGLERRADLNGLRMMLGGVDSADLTAVRAALGRISPSLGGSPSRFPALAQALGTTKQHMEAATRRDQIAGLLARQEKAAEEEIRRAADKVEHSLRQVALAKRQRDAAADRVERLEARRGADGVSAFDVTAAKLELHQAESDLLGKAVAWRIAEVKLLEAAGALAADCGYALPEGDYAAGPEE